VVSKEQLLEKVWGFQTDIELNNIEVYLSYLRKKLSKLDCGIVIETIRARAIALRRHCNMFKKLKIKFVMTNIVSITTILVIIFFGIYLSVKAFLKLQADIILYTIANEEN